MPNAEWASFFRRNLLAKYAIKSNNQSKKRQCVARLCVLLRIENLNLFAYYRPKRMVVVQPNEMAAENAIGKYAGDRWTLNDLLPSVGFR